MEDSNMEIDHAIDAHGSVTKESSGLFILQLKEHRYLLQLAVDDVQGCERIVEQTLLNTKTHIKHTLAPNKETYNHALHLWYLPYIWSWLSTLCSISSCGQATNTGKEQ